MLTFLPTHLTLIIISYVFRFGLRYACLTESVLHASTEVIGINRFGIAKMRTSTLMLASAQGRTDEII